MLKKWIFMGCGLLSAVAFAQNTPSPAKVVVYKWSQNGVTHYSTQPPRGSGNVVKLDERGLVIRDGSEDLAVFNAMRPVRPSQKAQENSSNSKAGESGADALPEGTITKEQRCQDARDAINIIENQPQNQPITIEDDKGNLVPMTEEQKAQRLQQAQSLVERLCNN